MGPRNTESLALYNDSPHGRSEMTRDAEHWESAYRAQTPPWDIGRPQPRFEALVRGGLIKGRVLDCGCGTGENALLAAAEGADVLGIDISPLAIEQARQKAADRSVVARFEVADALQLPAPDDSFDVVIDSGVFHSFDDTDRARYVASLRRVLRVGGRCYLMCFSDRQPGEWGPRRVSEAELRGAFARHWAVEVEPARFALNPIEGVTEAEAWLATLRRID
jgi:SAM-dependent methyltransferase